MEMSSILSVIDKYNIDVAIYMYYTQKKKKTKSNA